MVFFEKQVLSFFLWSLPSNNYLFIVCLEDLTPSFLPSFKVVTLFRHFAPGPRPRHSLHPAVFKSRNRSRIMSRLTSGQARSKSASGASAHCPGARLCRPRPAAAITGCRTRAVNLDRKSVVEGKRVD